MLFVTIFSVPIFAAAPIWSGAKYPVSWEPFWSIHKCGVDADEYIRLDYYFTDSGKYDSINSYAHNEYCGGSEHLVQAWSQDGKGQKIYGEKVGYRSTSNANQGAESGTDYAWMELFE